MKLNVCNFYFYFRTKHIGTIYSCVRSDEVVFFGNITRLRIIKLHLVANYCFKSLITHINNDKHKPYSYDLDIHVLLYNEMNKKMTLSLYYEASMPKSLKQHPINVLNYLCSSFVLMHFFFNEYLQGKSQNNQVNNISILFSVHQP